MALEWKDKYRIGDAKIDAEHQEWFRLAQEFLVAQSPESMRESGEAFSHYTVHHFFHEEILMHDIQYPFTATHVKEHESLMRSLKKILAVVGNDVLSKAELEDFVSYWLVKHIASYDTPFSVYVRRKGAAPVRCQAD